MKPIISPWIVYVAERCELVWQVSMIMFFFLCIAIVTWYAEQLLGETELIVPRWLKVAVLISGFLTIFVPDKTTVLTMVTLNYVTPDNIETATGTVTDVIDYVTDKIGDILEDE